MPGPFGGSSSQAVCFTHCHQASLGKRNHHCLHSSMSLSIFVDLGNITLRKYSMTFCFSTPARVSVETCSQMNLYMFLNPAKCVSSNIKSRGALAGIGRGNPK